MKDFPRTLLAELSCPYCGAGFRIGLELSASSEGLRDAVLCCDCYEYPVVRGIPVLRQMSPVTSIQNVAVDHLRKGDADRALEWLLAAGSGPGIPAANRSGADNPGSAGLLSKIRDRFSADPPSTEVDIRMLNDFESVLHAKRPGGYAHYLYQRFANPSFLGALPPAMVLALDCEHGRRKRMLELLSGAGHLSGFVSALFPTLDVIMADVDYVNLYIAQRFLAEDAAAICLDAELPLPFSDNSIDGIFCLDGLHYVRSKIALLEQVDRILGSDGIWLFAHMHNASVPNTNPGAPLDAAGYLHRFAFGQLRLLAESEILQQFSREGILDLMNQPPLPALNSNNALTLLGARDEHLWKRQTALDEALSRRPDLLALNPLYRLDKTSDGLMATASWPSESLQRECTGNTSRLPATLHLTLPALHEIAAVCAGQEHTDKTRELLRSFVLVPLPACYPRVNLLSVGSTTHNP